MGASGERAFLPKSKVMGIMALAFQSREFGFSMELTAEDLEKINRKRAQDVQYFDRVADQYVNEHTRKISYPVTLSDNVGVWWK